MNSAICTLYEGDYHYGVGVLTNSLYNHGFRGTVWVGYRGTLPPWATPLHQNCGYQEFRVAEGCCLRFIELSTRKFLANYKPDFMLALLEKYCPDAEALFYFDPDIVNKRHWRFYEQWITYGITLCEDAYDYMPANHPYRSAWKEVASRYGLACKRELDRYYNSGFIGIPRTHQAILTLWQTLLEKCEFNGLINLQNFVLNMDYPYFQSDQCVMNLALMLSEHPLSTFGRFGMDFGGVTNDLMSHASGAQVKPWRKRLILSALKGVPPSLADKAYWTHAPAPIPLYSKRQMFVKTLSLRIGSAIGRLIRRAY